MFTGIIEAVGKISALTPKGVDVSVTVDSGSLDLSDVKLGDSIATNGVCLTVVKLTGKGYVADLSLETLHRTAFANYKAGQVVNLEKAMLATTRFGGHMVSGHIDAVAEVIERQHIGRAIEFWIKVPPQLAKYISEKGSVAVDGISLTVNAVRGDEFKLTIVPHTAAETTMADFKVGRKINLEVDVIARYLERLMLGDKAAEKQSKVTMDLLARTGFLG
ncbi:riboflavin synthase subunit alpha [Photobacterium iliopiscarium]|jgi:riboflavin synthase|uniref:Riboflavin synthase n=1 Tax=Photobacterium iliopiscarium TaxID=56192 RepID=A0A0D8PT90_9GAMM|nr:riboflavin synthase [Photobacterium iliopiscarium]KJG14777.1 riboflavin synthase subunit alpha [Photobacterium iliopiscarium]KJG21182.1 riboflavin synthase subunit alpha [Photobacterium iliopiscarium]MCD9468394.1 riboflavin synthase [Photobacterium iliopiscarium]MCD9488357.1 riboflavin synthase [Photobacterium iliopiscarium]MCF2245120.1 riboflavin synthase [Photobacterium iliopiscarium]